ncbi:unnamed protein product [Sphenostylis stenocarpa]|uniref:Uncharacterized protein n=1 Tax=Sphenostylis stenocarpa TaxID=92480 RepID=A0AA86S2Y6_9FABA|nr:unnamed protein product [Sphenostylis stenocarpa]
MDMYITYLISLSKLKSDTHVYIDSESINGSRDKTLNLLPLSSPSSVGYQACGKSVKPVWRHNNKKHKQTACGIGVAVLVAAEDPRLLMLKDGYLQVQGVNASLHPYKENQGQ